MSFPYSDLNDYMVSTLKCFCKDDCIKAIEILKNRISAFEQNDLYLSIELIELPLSVRSTAALQAEGLRTVKDVLLLGLDKLCRIRNIGTKTEKEIRDIFEIIQKKKGELNGLSRQHLAEVLSSS